MKKIIAILLSLVLCFAMLVTLGACNWNDPLKQDTQKEEAADQTEKEQTPEETTDPTGEDQPSETTETTEETADNKMGSFALINEFLQGTLESGNFVVTTVQGEYSQVESVVADASCVYDSSTKTTLWAFKKGGKAIGAVKAVGQSEDEDGNPVESEQCYYMTGETYYNDYYCYFLSSIRVLDHYLTDEAGDFSCTVKTEKKGSGSKSTLSFEFATDGGVLTITAEAENGLVQSMIYTVNDAKTGEKVTNLTLTYGNASVEIPDITDWYDASYQAEEDDDDDNDDNNDNEDSPTYSLNKEESLQMLRDFFAGSFASENFTITTTQGNNTRKSSVVGAESCTVDSAAGTTICAFIRDGDYITSVESGDSRYYMTGETSYETNFCNLKTSFDYLDAIPESDFEFSCSIDKNGDGDEELSLNISNEENSVSILAIRRDGLILRSTTTRYDKEVGVTITENVFTYGDAELELPDLFGWTLVEP